MATEPSTAPVAPAPRAPASSRGRRRLIAGLEVALAVAVVVAVRTLPSLVLLVLMAASLWLHREGLASLGMHRVPRAGRMVLQVLALTAAWTVLTIAVTMPLLEHLTGERQDVSQFVELKGDLVATLVLIVLSWTLAAIGEELAFRGFVQTRMRELLPTGTAGLVFAVLASSVLFGFIHTEQGAVGVALSAIDAVYFSVLRYRYRTLWAAVLAHGFGNTIGLTTYFLVGPVSGLW